jgi:hypothetical protein
MSVSDKSIGLWTLVVAFVLGSLMTVISGCRFGNHSSSDDGDAESDPVSGFYGTSPQTLKFCTTQSAGTVCGNVATNQVPELIAEEMSDPVALILQDGGTGNAYFTAYNGGGQTALPVWVGEDNTTLKFVGSFNPSTLWPGTNCVSRMYLEEEGQVMPGEAADVPGYTSKTRGRVQLQVRITEVFDDYLAGNSCVAALQAMSDCYQNSAQCGGADSSANENRHEYVQSIFEPYIQAHAMTAADIATTANISYEIQYQ